MGNLLYNSAVLLQAESALKFLQRFEPWAYSRSISQKTGFFVPTCMVTGTKQHYTSIIQTGCPNIMDKSFAAHIAQTGRVMPRALILLLEENNFKCVL